ncbi:MAG: hypothetical protein ACRD88_00670 [Terriglobia bacterium]
MELQPRFCDLVKGIKVSAPLLNRAMAVEGHVYRPKTQPPQAVFFFHRIKLSQAERGSFEILSKHSFGLGQIVRRNCAGEPVQGGHDLAAGLEEALAGLIRPVSKKSDPGKDRHQGHRRGGKQGGPSNDSRNTTVHSAPMGDIFYNSFLTGLKREI